MDAAPGAFGDIPTREELAAFVEGLVLQVPAGSLTTPGALAEAMGDRGAARFVGELLTTLRERAAGREAGDHPPLHRVVMSTGEVRWRPDVLPTEGVIVADGKVANLDDRLFTAFAADGEPPLRQLRKTQEELASVVVREGGLKDPGRIAGVDVSYVRDSDEGVACCTVTDASGGEVLEQVTVRIRAAFPYISGYLGFREVPPMAEAVRALAEPPDVVLVDGHGLLHPRRFGVACHLGTVLELPAVGCAKRVLVGKVGKAWDEGANIGADEGADQGSDEEADKRSDDGAGDGKRAGGETARPVLLDGEHLGRSVIPRRGSRPAIISPAHRMGLRETLELVCPLLAHQMPEPVRLSHVASRDLVRAGSVRASDANPRDR
jgi:deoxyribonuclease V